MGKYDSCTGPCIPKKVSHLINNRTKAFCLISKMFFVSDRCDINIDLTSHF